MQKNIIIMLIVFMLSLFSSFVGYRWNEIKDIREKLTNVSTTENFKENFDIAIENILKEGEIKHAHKEWISTFIAKELSEKSEFKGTDLFLKIKLLRKNVSFQEKASISITIELMRLKGLLYERKIEVDNTIFEYKEIRKKFLSQQIESLFFGEKLNDKNIKYY
tara:strand:+ start:139377 stop:139868 length:492 start_codon:yes stop_codon:yes gene_type:complete